MNNNNSDGHRMRLRERFCDTGGLGVSDYELLELALMFAIPRKDVKPIAKDLIQVFGSLNGVLLAPQEKLEAVKGMGPSSAIFVKVVQQLSLRMKREKVAKAVNLTNRIELMDYLYTKFAHLQREEFHVLYLDAKLKLVADEMIFAGTLHSVNASPREVLKRALELNCSGIIVAHNHPSGNPTPSRADMLITEQLMMACAAMGLDLHDHVIVGADTHYSFRSEGKL
jgi:DNA repair protein RadC